MFFFGQLFEVESTFDKALFHRDGLPSNEISPQLLDQYVFFLLKGQEARLIAILGKGVNAPRSIPQVVGFVEKKYNN